MTQRSIRITVLVLTLGQLVLFSGLLAWRITVWTERGNAGLVFQREFSEKQKQVLKGLGPFMAFSSRSRAVITVQAGSPAERAGIRPGDLIVSVNGVPATDLDALTEQSKRLRAGDRVEFVLEREGGRLERALELGPLFPTAVPWVQLAVSIGIGVAFMAISALVAWTRPRSGTVLVFYLMSTVGALFYFVLGLFEIEFGNMRGLVPGGTESQFRETAVVFVAFFLLAYLLSSLLLHFALIFPRPRPIVTDHPRTRIWIYTGAMFPYAAAVATVAGLVGARRPIGVVLVSIAGLAGIALLVKVFRRRGSGRRIGAFLDHPIQVELGALLALAAAGMALRLLPKAFGPVIGIGVVVVPIVSTSVLMFAYAVAACVSLYRSYREAGVEEKRQVRWPLWGTIAAIGSSAVLSAFYVIVLWIMPRVMITEPLFAICFSAAMKLPYVLIPIAFAFGILKYRLMDIDLIIRKTAIYGAVTGIILVLYLGLVGILGVLLIRFTNVENQAVTVLSTLGIAAAFIPVRNGVQKFFDRRFFARRENLAEASRRLRSDVAAAEDLRPLLQRIAESVQQALQARTAAVFVLEPTSDILVLEAKVGLPDETLDRAEIDSEIPLLRARQRVIDLAVAELTPFERNAMRKVGARLAAPALVQGAPVGLLTVGRKLGGDPFDQDEIEFLRDAADHLSFALANLRKRREDVEFEQAREIQRSLLPATIPQRERVRTAALWKPAREVSGDYYDVLELDQGQIALCIGDVVGKGMPAALLMSSLQAAVRAIAPTEAPPEKVCGQVRRVVARNLTGGKFVTFFYGFIDAEAKTFRYANLGHNPAILVRADGTVERLAGRGGAIARLFVGESVEGRSVALTPGDRLVLFTDGASEARGAAAEDFGEDRLVDLVRAHRHDSPEALLATIEQEVEAFSGGNRADDLTMIAAAIGGSSE